MRPRKRLHNFTIWKFRDDGEYFIERRATSLFVPEDDEEELELVAQIQASSFLEAHLFHFGKLPPIDRTIRPLVLLMNDLGYMTEYSCSGHRGEFKNAKGYMTLIAESTQSARAPMRAVGDIHQAWLDENESWPPVSVTVEVSCLNLCPHRLVHEDEWPLRIGLLTVASPLCHGRELCLAGEAAPQESRFTAQ